MCIRARHSLGAGVNSSMLSDVAKRVRAYVRHRGMFDSLRFLCGVVIQVARGLVRGYWLVFLGRGVVIRGRSKVRIGRFTRIGDYCELDGFGARGLVIGEYCKIGNFSVLRVPPVPHVPGDGIVIGAGTSMAEFCFVGGAGLVQIGEGNAIGQYVSIHPQNHVVSEDGASNRTTTVGIKVGQKNWIAAKATLLDGCVLGDGCVVAAAAVVKDVFGSRQLIAGVPAKLKKVLD